MYHRFEENKYPSTNIKIDAFKEHLKIVQNSNFEFYHPKDFENNFDKPKKQKKFCLLLMMHLSLFTKMLGLY